MDGIAYTYQELAEFYRGRFKLDAIREYWEKECTLARADAKPVKKELLEEEAESRAPQLAKEAFKEADDISELKENSSQVSSFSATEGNKSVGCTIETDIDDRIHYRDGKCLAQEELKALMDGRGAQIGDLSAQQDVARLQAELQRAHVEVQKASHMHQEVERLQAELVRARQEAQKVLALQRHSQLEHCELWRTSKVLQFVDDPVLTQVTERLLCELSHQDATCNGCPSRCDQFKHVKVKQVRRIINPALWKKYCVRKDDMNRDLLEHKVTPTPIGALHQGYFRIMVPGLALDSDLNEVLLIHACPGNTAEKIARTGFDMRYSGTRGGNMYGKGIYFTHQGCKANQYTTMRPPPQAPTRTLLISRVALGDFSYLTQPYGGVVPMDRHPRQPDRGCFHSHVVDPQTCRHTQGEQAHWEHVIFDGAQAYPEFLVEYTIP